MFDPGRIDSFPEKPGVYIMKDKSGKVIYVGKAVSLKNRVKSYFKSGESLPAKVSSMVSHIEDIEYIVTDSEVEALILECNLIKFYRPKYNILLKDDKQYPYIKITMNESFPRIEVVRKIKKDRAKYFGPYVEARAMREAIDVLRKIFPIRSCKKDLDRVPLKERPCLNYHIKLCTAPCQGNISEEEYGELVKNIAMFLEGRKEQLLDHLKAKMREAANSLQFEAAAVYRDQIAALEKILEKQKISSTNLVDQDVIAMARGFDTACVTVFFVREGKIVEREPFILNNAEGADRKEILASFIKQFYDTASFIPKEIIVEEEIDEKEAIETWLSAKKGSKVKIIVPKRGEKKELIEMVAENAMVYLKQNEAFEERERIKNGKAMEELKNYLGLEKLPRRIEAFDISNTQGTESVASMVAFENGMPKKEDYRRFKIRTVEGPNDFESIKEAVFRRFKRGLEGDEKFKNFPDLLVIDGGKGQLRYALEALKELNLNHIPAIGLAKEFEHVFMEGKSEPIILPRNSEALYLLQKIRDEAHRFAVAYHRKLRSEKNLKSILEEIPGIGKVRRKALLNAFESLEDIKKASVEELTKVPGMNKKSAIAVYEYFHKA